MSEPRYDARTVEAPDGTRITVAVHPPGTKAVTDLAEERLRRHPCGTPYTADEIAPLLGGPDFHGSAERIADLINLVVDARLHGGGRHA